MYARVYVCTRMYKMNARVYTRMYTVYTRMYKVNARVSSFCHHFLIIFSSFCLHCHHFVFIVITTLSFFIILSSLSSLCHHCHHFVIILSSLSTFVIIMSSRLHNCHHFVIKETTSFRTESADMFCLLL